MSRKYSWRRGLAGLALIALAPLPAAAQIVPAWPTPLPRPAPRRQPLVEITSPAFAKLITGKSIVVLTKDGRDYEGVFTIAGSSLVMSNGLLQTTVPFDQVARVSKSTFRIKKHALIGLSVGAVFGGLFARGVCEGGCDASNGLVIVGLAAVSGAGIGAMNGARGNAYNYYRDIIYDAGTRTRTLAVAPVISRARKGLTFVFTWR